MDIALEHALEQLLALVSPAGSEEIRLSDAAGRVAAREVRAPIDLPPFDNSAMDGYAVRACDIASASSASPARLRVVGKAAAGDVFAGKLGAGECVRLFTGSVLPEGADAVVMQEDTRPEGAEAVLVRDSVAPGENVRRQGEDLGQGATLCDRGERLGAGRLSLLASAGLSRVAVGRRPTVGLLATGSELRESGQSLSRGQIYEGNRVGLAALVAGAHGVPALRPIVPDELSATQRALREAFKTCDMVVTCGGVSVGELDLVKPALEGIGGKLEFWRVSIKPGRPFALGQVQGKLLLGLPGNPVSALVTFLLLVRPAILRFQGASELALPAYPGRLKESISNPGNRRHFLRVRVDAEGNVGSAGTQASHILSSMAAANGLLDVAPGAILTAGTIAPVLRW